MKEFKLTIELVPVKLWNKSLYNYLTKDKWYQIKKEVKQREGNRCYICGTQSNRLELHEFWDYDDENHIQTLIEFHHLCSLCHKVKHIGFWTMTQDGIEKLKQEGYTVDDIINHFCRVNQCTRKDFERHKEEAFALWQERNKYKWTQSLGKYEELLTS